MRVLLFGAGEFGVPTFSWLREHHDVVGLVSQPDRPAGRRRQLTPAPAAAWAQEHGIPVLKTENVNTPEMVATIASLQPELAVVIAFGQKLSPQVIQAAGRLTVNLHSSLLPLYRGAAPINWAVLQGRKQTGVSVISLSQLMDAGLIYRTLATPIDPLETAGELHDRLARLGPQAIADVIDDLQHNRLHGQPQDNTLATRAPKLSKADSPIDFGRPADQVRCHIHGLTPWPGATATWHRRSRGEAQPVFLRRVRTADTTAVPTPATPPGTVQNDGRIVCNPGLIEILEIQLPGKRIMTLDEFTRGHAIEPGDQFTPQPPEAPEAPKAPEPPQATQASSPENTPGSE